MHTNEPISPFAAALEDHLSRGTRPDGSSSGVPWSNKEFANAVGAKSSEGAKDERTIRNWRNGKTVPGPADFHGILQALLGTGAEYADCRADLTGRYHTARGERQSEEGVAPPVAKSTVPTKPLRCLGRDDDLKAVVDALTAQSGQIAVLVLGGPGMGKTTLTRQAANDAAVIERFGQRRWLAELETATTAEVLEKAVIAALGLDPATSKFQDAMLRLAQAPGLLLLDNLETPWDAEREKVEDVLAALHRVPALALLVSIRGNEPPAGLRWSRQRTMHPLEPPHDRDLFLDIAQDIRPDDPHLTALLTELGGVPLAIELLAMQAAPGDTLAAIHDQWQRVGTALAQRRGVAPSRLTSLERSLELSFASPRLGDAGRRLFALLGQLPAGLCGEDLAALLGEGAFDAGQGLLASGLGHERGGRLDLLPPVRDHARRLHAPQNDGAAHWRNHFLNLAGQQAKHFNTIKGGCALARLAAELPNLDAALRAAIQSGDLQPAITARGSIAIIMEWTGLGDSKAIRELAQVCHAANNFQAEANCIKSVGNVALGRSDHDAARKAYEQALPLYRQVGDILGEANCIQRLGDVALERLDQDAAQKAHEEALPLYREVGDMLGEANCIRSLGHVALRRSDHDAAHQAYEQALPLYRRVGNILGEANCILSLGDIALARSDHDAARQAYAQALPLYRQVGDMLGEANCIQSLGDLALARSDHDAARKAYEQALALYERIAEPYSIGVAHEMLARITRGQDRAGHFAAARAAWTSIDRPDLVQTLDE
jgi:tetratricopeptide (TPR) repeat protein